MVLSGLINKQMVGYINAAGGKAIGLSGKDGNMLIARKLTRTVVDPDFRTSRGTSIWAYFPWSASRTRSMSPC